MTIENMSLEQLDVVGVVVDEYKDALLDVMYTDWFKKNHPDIARENDGGFSGRKAVRAENSSQNVRLYR